MNLMISRKDFLTLGSLSILYGLSGCGRSRNQSIIYAAKGTIPKVIYNDFQDKYIYKEIKITNYRKPFESIMKTSPDFISLSDGWVAGLKGEDFSEIKDNKLFERIYTPKTKEFISSFGPKFYNKIFPLYFSPWVILYRNSLDLDDVNSQDWDFLLNKELSKRLIMPRSPRFVISIARRIKHVNALQILKKQTLAFDDQNGFNWVSSGKAKAAVLPLSSCFDKLVTDSSLSIIFPKNGTPLSWTLLLQSKSSKDNFPFEWIERCWEDPLLNKLLSKGFIPPISYRDIDKNLNFPSVIFKERILEDNNYLKKCWSFSPLSEFDISTLENLWNMKS